jgi:AraC-like DNA-binding protein
MAETMRWLQKNLHGPPQKGFKLATIQNVNELESGDFWTHLRPVRTEYRRIQYSVLDHPVPGSGTSVSVRGAKTLGELEVAVVADQVATRMSIIGAGQPEYCLTVLGQGQLVYSGEGSNSRTVDPDLGLVYRGRPETVLSSAGAQERVAIWIPQDSLAQRLTALLDAPVQRDITFEPVFQWNEGGAEALRQLVNLLMIELQAPVPSVLGNDATNRSFSDLLIYAMLRALPHNYSGKIDQPRASATPGTLKRAEAYIRAHVEDAIALHEVAAAAGCSVRSLQMAFRQFRDTTPLLAIRRFRLEAARDALHCGDAGATITDVALRFGFTNPGRFTRFYRAAFGESPAEIIGRRGG